MSTEQTATAKHLGGNKENPNSKGEVSKLVKHEFRSSIIVVYALLALGALFYFLISHNPEILKLESETIILFQKMINVLVISLIPFIFGIFGALTRLMLSGEKTINGYIGIVTASGFMAVFSWLSIKSGIFLSLLLPHMQNELSKATVQTIESQNDFYSMILVATLVGMFSSNIYIIINKKVEAAAN